MDARSFLRLVLSIFLGLWIGGCQERPEGHDSSGGYTIVTTTGMVRDIVQNVAGDRATIVGLMGEGVDPHLYKPTPSDVAQIVLADIIFYNGLMLEGRMADAFIKVSRKNKFVYAVTEEVDREYLLEPPEFKGHWDPHLWMDAGGWSRCVQVVVGALSEYDPEHAETFQANATAYRGQLSELDSYVKQAISSIPHAQRVLISAHDAFNYFGRAYGIAVRGIQGISTESEAGLQDINGLVDFIVANKIQAVFRESTVSEKNIEALREGAASRGHDVQIGGELFSDAMGPTGTYEGTYIGMLDHNATTIARALGGNAPERGLHGKLSHHH